MNVEIGTEATQFPEKEYINENFLAVRLVLFGISYERMREQNKLNLQRNKPTD
jgi:hypothetical protein